MKHNECIAMLLAGGQGSRLKDLTKKVAKPAVSFGGKYRIIDFSLSNCLNSGINTVGVLTQYKPYLLNSYIGNGEAWDFNGENGGLFILPPFFTELGGKWYDGTADAIFSNIDFMDKFNPEYVLILSGDHLYKMNYNEMLEFTKLNNSDLTVSVIKVPLEDVSRFGIMSIDENNRITKFQEKPKKSDSTLASMGIYIFKYDVLRKILIMDHNDEKSEHDFGKNIIPKLIAGNYNLYAYEFKGYWQDVGTIDSYFVANMQLLDEKPLFDIFEKRNKIYSNNNIFPPHFVGKKGCIKNSLICNGCIIDGYIESSIVAGGVVVENGAKVIDSIIFPGTRIKKGAKVYRAILGESVIVEENVVVGSMDKNSEIELIGDETIIKNEGRKK